MTYLIVPLHNDQERLREFVACLNAQTVKPFVLWVDNGTKNCARCVVRSYRGGYLCLPITRGGYSRNYWTGCLKTAQEWLERVGSEHIVGIMNNDVTFGPDYIERATGYSAHNRIVSSLIVDAATGREVQKGVRFLWSTIFTRQYGAISTVSRLELPYDAMRDSGVFLTVGTFRKIHLHAHLLPHYCNDYTWTNRLIRGGVEVRVPDDLRLSLDFSTTGIVNPKSLRELFSVRCPHNPIIYTVFILLVCPLLWKLPNIIRVWGYAVVRAWRILKGGEPIG